MTDQNEPKYTLSSMVSYAIERHPELVAEVILRHKLNLSKQIVSFHENTVAHGPFRGLKLNQSAFWGEADRASMILGMYEQEILNELFQLQSSFKNFIDIGAADGYYGVGVVVSNMFDYSYCFEANPEGQNVILETAKMNHVESRVHIFGSADKSFYNVIPEDVRQNSVLLVDIEGAEFELFTEEIFSFFRKSPILIELHDWFFPDSADKIRALKINSSKTHKWTQLYTGSRNPGRFLELSHLNDTDRWLICSEHRAKLMSWARLDPL